MYLRISDSVIPIFTSMAMSPDSSFRIFNEPSLELTSHPPLTSFRNVAYNTFLASQIVDFRDRRTWRHTPEGQHAARIRQFTKECSCSLDSYCAALLTRGAGFCDGAASFRIASSPVCQRPVRGSR